jgi:hypothetical protein
VSIRVHPWFFSSFKTVAMVLFLDGGIIGGFAKNYNPVQLFFFAFPGGDPVPAVYVDSTPTYLRPLT